MLMNTAISSNQIGHHTGNEVDHQSGVHRFVQQPLRRIIDYFYIRLSVARQRRDLLALDDRALTDLGISRSDVIREADRSFWDLPLYLR